MAAQDKTFQHGSFGDHIGLSLQNVEGFLNYTSLEALVLLKYHRGKAGSI